jgi:hypothetical protein
MTCGLPINLIKLCIEQLFLGSFQMPEDETKSESTKGGDSSKAESGLHHFERRSSGDQGVYLQPLGTQDNNPFNPPQQPASQAQPADSPSSSQVGADSSSSPEGAAPKGE